MEWGKGIGREWSLTRAKLLLVADKAYSFQIAYTPLYSVEGLKLSSLVLKASLHLKLYLGGVARAILGYNQNHISVKESSKSNKKKTCCYFQAWVLIAKRYFLCLSNLSRAQSPLSSSASLGLADHLLTSTLLESYRGIRDSGACCFFVCLEEVFPWRRQASTLCFGGVLCMFSLH